MSDNSAETKNVAETSAEVAPACQQKSAARRRVAVLVVAVLLILTSSILFLQRDSAIAQDARRLGALARRLHPLHGRMGPVRPGDWLASHKEPGQSFRQYVGSNPNRPTARRNKIYVQPIGSFNKKEQQALKDTVEFIRVFYGLQVVALPALGEEAIPAEARRTHPRWGDRQWLTTYILYNLLKPKQPTDAVAVLGLTTTDLWPGEGWNFVFGQADLRQRVGVWSMYRNGKTDTPKDYRLYLRRTLKTAVHELGHMLSIQHCIAYKCCMNGANNRSESDRQPLMFCPECVQKIWYSCDVQPRQRYQNLQMFAQQRGLEPEAQAWQKAYHALAR